MRRVLLDTSGYSAFMRAHPGVGATIRRVDEIVVSPILLGELRTGFRHGALREQNEQELSGFLGSPRVRLATIDAETADRYAEIMAFLRRAGTPVPTNDAWIAATAMQHGLAVLTTDPHFERIPHVLVDLHQ